jgi:hypothetical protein
MDDSSVGHISAEPLSRLRRDRRRACDHRDVGEGQKKQMSYVSGQANSLIGKMLDAISRFERKELPIDGLFSDLRIQIAALAELVDRDWVEKIREMRNDIEVVNATFLNSGRETLTLAERDEAQKTIDTPNAALEATLVAGGTAGISAGIGGEVGVGGPTHMCCPSNDGSSAA